MDSCSDTRSLTFMHKTSQRERLHKPYPKYIPRISYVPISEHKGIFKYLKMTGFLSVRFMGTFWELFFLSTFSSRQNKSAEKKVLSKPPEIVLDLRTVILSTLLDYFAFPPARGHPNILYFRPEDLCGRFLPKIFEQKIFAEDL